MGSDEREDEVELLLDGKIEGELFLGYVPRERRGVVTLICLNASSHSVLHNARRPTFAGQSH